MVDLTVFIDLAYIGTSLQLLYIESPEIVALYSSDGNFGFIFGFIFWLHFWLQLFQYLLTLSLRQESRREGWTDAAVMLCKLNKSL